MPVYDSLRDTLGRNFEREVAFLKDLIRQPTANPPGDLAVHGETFAALLRELGLEVEAYPIPAELCRRSSMVSATNLVVRKRFGGNGPTVALNAHGDAVRPGDGWTGDPYGGEIRDGWIYGRAAAVSKSDIAAYTFALLALAAENGPLDGTVELHLTFDEETGGLIGPKRLLETGVSRPDYVICPGFSYNVVTAHNGCLHLKVTIKGRSSHAAWPDKGHDALQASLLVLEALYREREGYGAIRSGVPGIDSPTMVIGLIEGGINTNVVPDSVSFRLDRRMIPEEKGVEVEARLRAVVEGAIAGKPGIACEVERLMLAEPLAPSDGANWLGRIVLDHARSVFGLEITNEGVPLYTDARHYAEAGIPTVLYGVGPRTLLESNVHGADERVALDDLRKATEVVARTLHDVLSPTATAA